MGEAMARGHCRRHGNECRATSVRFAACLGGRPDAGDVRHARQALLVRVWLLRLWNVYSTDRATDEAAVRRSGPDAFTDYASPSRLAHISI